jgi:hypothetical protein
MPHPSFNLNEFRPRKSKMQKARVFFARKKKAVIIATVIIIAVVGFFGFVEKNKVGIAINSLKTIGKAYELFMTEGDAKKELDVVNQLADALTKNDNVERTFLILLQNNMELRPGGGFLGQYAILKLKNGQVTSTFVEDANILDQRITTDVATPYPFKKMLQLKNWKFRDSNFSPDFPTNAEKAKYFYRLAGGGNNFDGVIAVNATVLNDLLELTGPITVSGTEFNSQNAVLKLEEIVEKIYIQNPDLDTQNRKDIMKKMAPVLIEKLATIGNVSKLADFFHKEMQKKNVMINFKDTNMQNLVSSVFWDGKVAQDWGSDFFMLVDANMGALKTDYYMKREISYDVDLTVEKPTVTVNILYKNTAPAGDWRTSDYHGYLRIYAPKGSTFLERKMIGYPYINQELGKTYFGMKLDVVMGKEVNGMLKYQLPDNFDKNNYRLLIQKQSGVDDTPVKIHIKTKDGEFSKEATLVKDLRFDIKKP